MISTITPILGSPSNPLNKTKHCGNTTFGNGHVEIQGELKSEGNITNSRQVNCKATIENNSASPRLIISYKPITIHEHKWFLTT